LKEDIVVEVPRAYPCPVVGGIIVVIMRSAVLSAGTCHKADSNSADAHYHENRPSLHQVARFACAHFCVFPILMSNPELYSDAYLHYVSPVW